MKIGLGKHLLIDIYECNCDFLDNVDRVEAVMIELAESFNATIIKSVYHQFSPYGVSGVTVIAESHVAIHTWPEHRFAAIDLFTCGDQNLDKALSIINALFLPQRTVLKEFTRG